MRGFDCIVFVFASVYYASVCFWEWCMCVFMCRDVCFGSVCVCVCFVSLCLCVERVTLSHVDVVPAWLCVCVCDAS